MRDIHEIIVHCTATPEGRYVDVPMVRQWHKDRGFNDIGYHFLIGLEGEIWTGRPTEKTGAHVKGHNTGTIGIAYVGGVDSKLQPKDTRTERQKAALLEIIKGQLKRFPAIEKISGHRDYAAKACPSFDATAEYAYLLNKDEVKPAFQNPMADNEKLSNDTDIVKILKDANFLQKQARDKLDQAAALHWKVMKSLNE